MCHCQSQALNLLAGGRDDDKLVGGIADDTLTGGKGNDVFQFASGDGHDIISDFGRGADEIEIAGLDLNGFSKVLSGATQMGEDVVIDLGTGSIADASRFFAERAQRRPVRFQSLTCY